MINYLIRRLGTTIITIIVLSYTIFAIVQIPPGDAVDRQVRGRQSQGDVVTREEIETLRESLAESRRRRLKIARPDRQEEATR